MRSAVVVVACLSGCGNGGQAQVDSSSDGLVGDGLVGDVAATSSRCSVGAGMITCTSHGVQIGGRTVTYEVPIGTPPAAGWPSVIYYQGSFVAGARAFAAATTDLFGQYELTSTVKALLDRGYAVIAPEALDSSFWETNVAPYATSWAGCGDDVFVQALLAAVGDGTFGTFDPTRHYAMGISSGGFMTSRMAVSYPGTFRALAIASGSYATCSSSCTVPDLPTNHPPTLFLHGDADNLVPVSTMTAYRDKLVATGHVAQSIIDAGAGHEWLPEGKTAIPDFFDAH